MAGDKPLNQPYNPSYDSLEGVKEKGEEAVKVAVGAVATVAESARGAIKSIDFDALNSSMSNAANNVSSRIVAYRQEPSQNITVKSSISKGGWALTFAGVAIIVLAAVGAVIAGLTSILLPTLGAGLGIAAGVGVAGGACLVVGGASERGFAKRLEASARAMSNRLVMPIDDLSEATGVAKGKLRRSLEKAIKRGYIPQGRVASMDGQETLFLTEGAYQDYVQAQTEFYKREAAAQAEQAALDEKDAQLPEQARTVVAACMGFEQRVNAASAQIGSAQTRSSIQSLCEKVGRIAGHIRKHPDDAGRLNRYTGYYLPTMAKLVDSYAELDSVNATGDNADATRRDVDEMLTTLSDATDKLIDDLLQSTQWDISSDANVMKKMLTQDGLVEGGEKQP